MGGLPPWGPGGGTAGQHPDLQLAAAAGPAGPPQRPSVRDPRRGRQPPGDHLPQDAHSGGAHVRGPARQCQGGSQQEGGEILTQ